MELSSPRGGMIPLSRRRPRLVAAVPVALPASIPIQEVMPLLAAHLTHALCQKKALSATAAFRLRRASMVSGARTAATSASIYSSVIGGMAAA